MQQKGSHPRKAALLVSAAGADQKGRGKQEGESPGTGKQRIQHVHIFEESKGVWGGCVHEREGDRP